MILPRIAKGMGWETHFQEAELDPLFQHPTREEKLPNNHSKQNGLTLSNRVRKHILATLPSEELKGGLYLPLHFYKSRREPENQVPRPDSAKNLSTGTNSSVT